MKFLTTSVARCMNAILYIEQIMNYGNDIFVDGLVNFTINTFGILILTFLVKKIVVKYLKK